MCHLWFIALDKLLVNYLGFWRQGEEAVTVEGKRFQKTYFVLGNLYFLSPLFFSDIWEVHSWKLKCVTPMFILLQCCGIKVVQTYIIRVRFQQKQNTNDVSNKSFYQNMLILIKNLSRLIGNLISNSFNVLKSIS